MSARPCLLGAVLALVMLAAEPAEPDFSGHADAAGSAARPGRVAPLRGLAVAGSPARLAAGADSAAPAADSTRADSSGARRRKSPVPTGFASVPPSPTVRAGMRLFAGDAR